MLGYRDSGMPDTEANARPEAFANAPLDEAVGRLVEIIRRERPQVIVTYSDDQPGYPHPDHLMVHDISLPGLRRGRRPRRLPRAGRAVDAVEALLHGLVAGPHGGHAREVAELGLESPFTEDWFKRPSQDDRITTQVSLEGYEDVRNEALLAHATQVDPNSPFWFGLPRDVSRTIHPFDDYVLAQSRVRPSSPRTTSSPACADRPVSVAAGVTGRASRCARSAMSASSSSPGVASTTVVSSPGWSVPVSKVEPAWTRWSSWPSLAMSSTEPGRDRCSGRHLVQHDGSADRVSPTCERRPSASKLTLATVGRRGRAAGAARRPRTRPSDGDGDQRR